MLQTIKKNLKIINKKSHYLLFVSSSNKMDILTLKKAEHS